MSQFMLFLIVALGLLNLVRMAVYMISSDIYYVKAVKKYGLRRGWYLPTVTIIIPAYNEEKVIERSLGSAIKSRYPRSNLKIIVANDGSKDTTAEVVTRFMSQQKPGSTPHVQLLNLPNRGKAGAMNYALTHHVTSEYVMCLDADSALHEDALLHAVQHFKDSRVVALSSNINIWEDGSLMSMLQRIEYLVGYQMKRGQSLLGVEYIVGGIGSMFRMDVLRHVQFYDSNTMTEDIDLTMKILMNKEKHERIAYAYDSLVYTEAAHSMKELSTQRFRWKFGRSQTFLKHISLFFSTRENHQKRVSWFMLPHAIFQDMAFFVEPLVLIWMLFLVFYFHDFATVVTAMLVVTAYLAANIWAAQQLNVFQRIRLTFYALPMYFLMYVLSGAEYYALIKTYFLAPTLKKSISGEHVTWTSPARKGSGATA